MTLAFLVFLAALTTAQAAAAPSVVYEDSGKDWAERYIMLNPFDFSLRAVQDIANENLNEFDEKRIVKVVIGIDRDDLLYMRKGTTVSDYSFQRWAELFSERIREQKPMAVVLSINGNALLRFRDPTGQFRELVLKGSYPLLLAGAKQSLQLVHVGFEKVPFDGGSLVQIVMFVTSAEEPSVANVQASAVVIGRSVSNRDGVLLIFRNDSWFIDNERFPPMNVSSNSSAPPPLNWYVCSPTVVCKYAASSVSCRRQEYSLGTCR
jgi:hypothetical protein